MKTIRLISIIGYFLHIERALTAHCYLEMNYEKFYGYKNDITCNNVNESSTSELESFKINTKVKLTIDGSNLTNITSKLFKNIPKMMELIIRNSLIPKRDVFKYLNHLEALVLTNDSIVDVPSDYFETLPNLRLLNMSNNHIAHIVNGTFANIDLQELDLSFNSFNDFDVPCEMQQLSLLDLSYNHLRSLKNFPTHCLSLLTNLRIQSNSITDLTSLEPIRYLTKVDVSYNQIHDVSDAFVKVQYLKELNLARNKLKNIAVHHFNNLEHLRKLDLAYNVIADANFGNLTSLEDLNLQFNTITNFPSFGRTALKRLDLSHNFLTLDYEVRNLSEIRELYLRHCKIHEINTQLHHLKSLQILDLSFNGVVLNDLSFMNLNELRELQLSGNSLDSIPNLSLQNLKIMNLSRNSLTRLNEVMFTNLQEITVLDLSYNHLVSLDENTLQPLEDLSELNLQHNRLKYVSYAVVVSSSRNLRVFNVRDNSFSCQFLSAMVAYFNINNIDFGFRENTVDFNENVAGILCHESEVVVDVNSPSTILMLTVVFVSLVLLSFVIGTVYRIIVYVRHKTNIDEIELIDSRLRLRNYM